MMCNLSIWFVGAPDEVVVRLGNNFSFRCWIFFCHVTLSHAAPTTSRRLAQVGVKGLVRITVVDHHHITISPSRPTGEDDHTTIGCVDRSAITCGDIDPKVTGPVIIPRKGVIGRWPGECAAAVCPFVSSLACPLTIYRF